MVPGQAKGAGSQGARVLFLGAPVGSFNATGWTLADRFAAYGRNTGNLLIGQSLREELRISRYGPAGTISAAEANEKFDIIVVAAANFIFRGFDRGPYAKIIEDTNLPCMVAGLGAQAPHAGEKPTDIPEGTKRFLKVIAERSKVIGVRGNFTAEVMNEFGITNVRPIGCPSLFRSLKRDLRVRLPVRGNELRISVNGSRDMIAHMRAPDDARRVEAALIRLSMEGHKYVLQSEEPEIHIVERREVTPEHRKQVQHICASLELSATEDAFIDHLHRNGCLFFELERWDDHIRKCDLSIGSRIHGTLIALTNSIPAILLNHDSRTTEMAELIGIPHVFTEDVKTLIPSELLQEADYKIFEARYRVLYDRFADFLTENGLAHNLVDAKPAIEPDKMLPSVGRMRTRPSSDHWKWIRSALSAFDRN